MNPKGGGGSFGVVTTYTLRAFPQCQVWGGVRLYPSTWTREILAAVRDFTENGDEKAGLIAAADTTGFNLVETWVVIIFYNGPTPPSNVFAHSDKIPHVADTLKTRSFHDLMVYNNNFVLKNSICTIGAETTVLPNRTVAVDVMMGYYDGWRANARSVGNVYGLVASIAFQPMPMIITRKSNQYGGVALNIDDSVDHLIFELDYSYWFERDTPRIDAIMQKSYADLGAKVKDNQQTRLL